MIVIANSNPAYKEIESKLAARLSVTFIRSKQELEVNKVGALNPAFIFFLHWSFIIPPEVFQKFNCIVFHMTDLPFGRGGSPLQNLILRGFKETMLSAIKVEKGIDTGPIYMKRPLSLAGSATEIFHRAGDVMLDMIEEIVSAKPTPVPQTGEVVIFKRRTPPESDMTGVESVEKLYDFIRMLDAEGYPKAFAEIGTFRLEFSKAELADGGVTATVQITKKNESH